MATTRGAQALGLNAGRIAPGHFADICILKPGTRIRLAADIVQSLVYSENGSSVDTVLVDGDVVLEDGVSSGIDQAVLGCHAAELAERIRWRPNSNGPIASSLWRLPDFSEKEYREAASMGLD